MNDIGLFPASDLAEDLLGPRGGDDDMLRTAWLSDDKKYRWTLNRIWGDHHRLLAWIMLNPSLADALKDDPTIQQCMKFARRLGYGGLTVVNLYALITPYPTDLAAGWDTGGTRNDGHLQQVLEQAERHDLAVIAAWGNNARQDRVDWLLRQPHSNRLCSLGVTLSGAPKHPLARGKHRIPVDAQPTPWPVPS